MMTRKTHTHTKYLKTSIRAKYIIINSVIKSVAAFVLFMLLPYYYYDFVVIICVLSVLLFTVGTTTSSDCIRG